MNAYTALALQTRCDAINRCATAEAARASMAASIARIRAQIRSSRAFIGPELKLVVLPEYVLTGFPMGEPITVWAERAALVIDGPEYAALGEICRESGVYLAGNAYERDPKFPELYFQTSFILDQDGVVVLRYRRLNSLYGPTPHDVWDRYLEHYGLESVFPVVDTPLGRLACVASEEILYPEISRAFAVRGAEVLLHSTSEAGSSRLTPKEIARRARAYENSVYVISANTAGIYGVDLPAQSTDGLSKLVDFVGEVRAEAGFGESMVAHATIDIAALRRHRLTPGMANMLSRQRFECFRDLYSDHLYPANSLLGADGFVRAPDRAHFRDAQRATIDALLTRGILRRE